MDKDGDTKSEHTPPTDRDDTFARLEELWELCREISASMPDDVTSNHDWLYDDETGLPA